MRLADLPSHARARRFLGASSRSPKPLCSPVNSKTLGCVRESTLHQAHSRLRQPETSPLPHKKNRIPLPTARELFYYLFSGRNKTGSVIYHNFAAFRGKKPIKEREKL